MIDKNRPQTRRTTARGVTVVEFFDQRGAYFDVKGNPVSEPIAKAAGYDTKEGARLRRKRELEDEAQKRIDKQVEREFGSIEKQLDEEAKTQGWRIEQNTSTKKYAVFDDENHMLIDDLTKKEAEEALETFQHSEGPLKEA